MKCIIFNVSDFCPVQYPMIYVEFVFNNVIRFKCVFAFTNNPQHYYLMKHYNLLDFYQLYLYLLLLNPNYFIFFIFPHI